MGMAARDFYDLSFCEWLAALDGYMAAQGIERAIPATSADFAALDDRPSGSIRQ